MRKLIVCIAVLLLAACQEESVTPDTPTPEIGSDLITQEYSLDIWLDNYGLINNFTLLLASKSDHDYSHSVGNSSATTVYESASASKLVATVVILDVVEDNDNLLTLNSKPQDFIYGWPKTGKLSEITLAQLLNFTSGLNYYPQTCNRGSLENCVTAIKNQNGDIATGSQFYYNAAHLQVAGLMAVRASGKTSWEDLFAEFKSTHGLFDSSSFSIPSTTHPRLAGGMRFTAEDYMEFMQKLHNGSLLNTTNLTSLRTALGAGATIVYSPAADIYKTWRYGFGAWLEDISTRNTACVSDRISSPGAYGAYPFIDFEKGYWGILARQSNDRSFPASYRLMNAGREAMDNWANLANSD